MSKKLLSRITFVVCISGMLIAVGGCNKGLDEDQFSTITVPQEKVKRIETLDIKAMKKKEDKPAEPNLPSDELTLTLEEVRAITLRNNLNLKVELLNPTKQAESTNAVEAAKYAVVFSSNVSFAKTDQPPYNIHLSGSQREEIRTNLGVRVPLQTGGSINFNLGDNYGLTNLQDSDDPEFYTSPFTFSVSQPLLKNAGKRQFMHSIRVAGYREQQVNATTKLKIIETIARADRAYWDMYKKRRVLEVRHSQYDLANAQLERARRFVEAGQNPQVELIRAEAGLAAQLSTIIAAENDLRRSQREMKRILNRPGLSMETATSIIPGTDPDPVEFYLDKDKLVEYAVENRMDMLQLELEIAINLSNIESLRNAALPDLSLNYGYGVGGRGGNRRDSYRMLRDKNYEDHSVSLNLTHPLGNKVAKSNLRGALYLRRQQLASRQGQRDVIEQDVLNALDGLETSWQKILSDRQSAILNGRLYRAEQRQFELGMRTSTEVLSAQATFSDSQSAEYTALADYQIALVTLAEATGTLLGAAKIDWEPAIPDIGIDP